MIKKICLLLALTAASCDKPASRPATGPTSAPALRQVHVFVRGRVQGVGFRAFTKKKADEVEVKGWVKNLLDGRVEAVMQGRTDDIEKVLRNVRQGPPSSKVDGVEVEDEAIRDRFADFKVIEGQ